MSTPSTPLTLCWWASFTRWVCPVLPAVAPAAISSGGQHFTQQLPVQHRTSSAFLFLLSSGARHAVINVQQLSTQYSSPLAYNREALQFCLVPVACVELPVVVVAAHAIACVRWLSCSQVCLHLLCTGSRAMSGCLGTLCGCRCDKSVCHSCPAHMHLHVLHPCPAHMHLHMRSFC